MKKLLLNDETINLSYEMYQKNIKLETIAETIGYSMYVVKKNLRLKFPDIKFGKRASKVNEDYFKIINKESSYILGLIAADGYIIDNRRNTKRGQNYWGISLQDTDKKILENIKICINLDKNLYFRKKRNINWKDSYILEVRSNKMVEDIKNIGIGPRKSLTLKIPKIFDKNKNLFIHFIRGYFDGDGCITSSKYNNIEQYKVSIVGSYDSCNYMAKFFKNIYNIGTGKIHKKKNIYVFYISGNNNIKKLYNILYENASLFLDRKKQKFEELVCCQDIKV